LLANSQCHGSSELPPSQGNDCVKYLEQHGQSGRVLVDQPALWTENEGGFQTWGGAPPPGKEPYFWGRSIADQALSVMRWVARGGSHMDYYMWVGGSNFGRYTGDGITTMYAVDASLCPDGLPHEPKFSHLAAMHHALAVVAAPLLSHTAQLDRQTTVGGGAAVVYTYGDVAFLEAAAPSSGGHITWKGHSYTLPAGSSSLVNVTSGETLFNSLTGSSSAAPTEQREVRPARRASLGPWRYWREPISIADALPYYPTTARFEAPLAMEMTNMTRGLTTFAFYETSVTKRLAITASALTVPTFEAMSMTAFIDGDLVGAAEDHTHGDGKPLNLSISLSPAPARTDTAREPPRFLAAGGSSALTLLAEELGYANYGFKVPLSKGLSSAGVLIDGEQLRGPWKMRVGLAGEHAKIMELGGSSSVPWASVQPGVPHASAVWFQTSFSTPEWLTVRGTELLLNATGLKRGRIWVNGLDAGRYWLLARNDGSACPGGAAQCATQTLYHLPKSWLLPAASGIEPQGVAPKKNLLTIFEAEGGAQLPLVGLAMSTMGGKPQAVDPTQIVSCVF
jgi:beta-galactosidase